MSRVIWKAAVSFSLIHIPLGMIVVRTRQYMCAVLPAGETLLLNTLVLNTLRYADEVLPPEPYAPAAGTLDQAKVSQREFAMAVKLVEDMRQQWQPKNYHDTYREDLLRRIESKVTAGKTKTLTAATTEPRERRTAEVLDLGELLKRSLAQRGGKTGAEPAKRVRPAAARARSSGATAASRRRRA